jgi:hypothetical protein
VTLEEMVEHLGQSLTADERRERLQRHRWELATLTWQALNS